MTRPDDRDRYVRKTPPKGVAEQIGAAPEFVSEEDSSAYSHDPVQLRQFRSKRPTDERFARLEAKYDALVHKVIDSRTKITLAIVSAIAGLISGYILGGCVS